MVELIEANWLLLLLAFVIGLLIALYVFRARRRTRITTDTTDVLDAGAPRASRNQALIDAPPAAGSTRLSASPEPVAVDTPDGLAGVGPAVSLGAMVAEVEAAEIAQPTPAQVVPEPVPAEGPTVPPIPPADTGTHKESQAATQAPTEAEDAAGVGEPMPLSRLKGVGPKLTEHLRTLGVSDLRQVAGWNDADIDRYDAQLGRFQGRIRRDDWVTQAKLLSAGDLKAYEARFGSTGGDAA